VDERVVAAPDDEAIRLAPDDGPEMLALINRTRPGPFFPRTIELGTYLGIRRTVSFEAVTVPDDVTAS
jgi:hypothetical protein